jgi:hypothetical protein
MANSPYPIDINKWRPLHSPESPARLICQRACRGGGVAIGAALQAWQERLHAQSLPTEVEWDWFGAIPTLRSGEPFAEPKAGEDISVAAKDVPTAPLAPLPSTLQAPSPALTDCVGCANKDLRVPVGLEE